jgi:glycosyltransferase involved in cell wall biosynthesis
MLQALAHVSHFFSNVVYLVVGDGPSKETLIEDAKKYKVLEKVIFVGMQSNIPRYLSVGDIFILPTLTEALPTVLAEAMAARLPIIASDVGGIPEMVIQGLNGSLVKPGDVNQLAASCLELLAAPDKRKQLGNNGWKYADNNFNIHKQVSQLKSLYMKHIT